MLLFALLGEKSVTLLFQCQFIKAVFLTYTNRTSTAIFQKIVPNVNSANYNHLCVVQYIKKLPLLRRENPWCVK